MSKIDAILVLGCKGHQDKEGFSFCCGVSNPILELKKLNNQTHQDLVIFLDKACGLFNSSVDDYNKCFNILNIIYKKYKVFDEELLNKIQYYLHGHKLCQPYLVLIMREDYYGGRGD